MKELYTSKRQIILNIFPIKFLCGFRKAHSMQYALFKLLTS